MQEIKNIYLLSWGVPEFQMLHSDCFPAVFLLPGNGAVGKRGYRG
jgi:hypothetical protein